MKFSKRVTVQLLCATLAFLGSVGIVSAAWDFQSPAQDAIFSKTSNIGFSGNNAPNSTAFTVQCYNDDTNVIEQSVGGTSMPMGGSWGGTLTCPSGNWIPDNPDKHLLKVTGGADRRVKIQ